MLAHCRCTAVSPCAVLCCAVLCCAVPVPVLRCAALQAPAPTTQQCATHSGVHRQDGLRVGVPVDALVGVDDCALPVAAILPDGGVQQRTPRSPASASSPAPPPPPSPVTLMKAWLLLHCEVPQELGRAARPDLATGDHGAGGDGGASSHQASGLQLRGGAMCGASAAACAMCVCGGARAVCVHHVPHGWWLMA